MMKSSLLAIFSLIIILSFTGCKKEKSERVEVTGVLKIQGITTYQYGTHTIENNNEYYALKSDNYDLNNYLNQTVTVIGQTITGYPISGGPYYLDVI